MAEKNEKTIKNESSPERFELSRGIPMHLASTRLNHSAKATVDDVGGYSSFLINYLIKQKLKINRRLRYEVDVLWVFLINFSSKLHFIPSGLWSISTAYNIFETF